MDVANMSNILVDGQPPNPEQPLVDFREDEKVKRYLNKKTKRESTSDDDEEYSLQERKMVKTEPKYAEKDLYKKLLQLKRSQITDDDSNETTKEKENSESDNNKENMNDNVINTNNNNAKGGNKKIER